MRMVKHSSSRRAKERPLRSHYPIRPAIQALQLQEKTTPNSEGVREAYKNKTDGLSNGEFVKKSVIKSSSFR